MGLFLLCQLDRSILFPYYERKSYISRKPRTNYCISHYLKKSTNISILVYINSLHINIIWRNFRVGVGSKMGENVVSKLLC